MPAMNPTPAFPRTMILTCSRDGRYCTGYTMGLLESRAHPAFAGWMPAELESDIARGRIRLITTALEETDAPGLLFVDDDMHWRGQHFETVLAAAALGCDIVGGLYSKRQANGGLVYGALPVGAEEHPACPDLLTVREVGTGFLWIRRTVFEKLAPLSERVNTGKKPWFHFFPAGTTRNPASDEVEYLSEDYAFCRAAQRAGFKVWLHRGVRLGHEGKQVFSC